MEWDPSGAGDESAAGYNDNPWTSPPTAASSSCSNTGTASGSGSQGSSSNKSGLPVNPLYQGSPELGSNPDEGSSRIKPNNGILNPEATRPTLYRLTSGGLNGLLQGLDSLSFPNASQESISTEDAGPNGARRSLDELRRLSIKGKGREIDVDDSSYHFLGEDSLKSAKAQIRGREALLHPVEDGDTLQRLALLYGCTVPAIRSANKMWAKDPIYPRKTLYIPLDACKQPPSREVEFVQKSGQDEVQMFFRDTSVPTAPSFAQMLNSNGTSHNGGRTRSASLRLEALAELPRPLTPYHDSDPSSQADSPFTSQRSSFSQSRQPPASAHFSYLSSTNSEYDEMEDEAYRKRTWSGTGTPDDPSLKSLSVTGEIAASDVSSAAEHAPSTATIQQKTLQIVQIPGTNIKKSASVPSGIARTRGNSPLISVDNLQEPGPSMTSPPPSAAVVSVSSTSIGTPSLSNDRLSVVSGVPANLRQRPRSPFDGDTTPFPSMSTGSTLPSELPRPSARTRKISKEAVPSSKNNSSLPRLPGSLGKYITSAGGMLSSIMGDKGDSGWLATNELETEMQMAREYQSRHQQRASLSNDRMIHSRSRSQASLRETSFNTDFGRRAPSLSSDHL